MNHRDTRSYGNNYEVAIITVFKNESTSLFTFSFGYFTDKVHVRICPSGRHIYISYIYN